MKSIKEKAKEVFPIEEHDSLETELIRRKMRLCYEDGANYVLNAIEEFMANKYFGSITAEMFYKDIKTNIHKFIEQLKGN